MKAAVVARGRPPAYADFAEPTDSDGCVVVEVRAAALTNLDIAIAEGRHYFSPAAYPVVLGRECVGRTPAGKRCFFNARAIPSPYGSMAERAPVRLASGLPVPDAVPDTLAAALGNAGLAAWLPLSWRARLRPGETVLVLGATGTSGLLAVAAAKLLGAGRVIAVGRNSAALEETRRLGADAEVNLLETEDLAAACRAAAPAGIDVVVDYLNGPAAEAALQVMAEGGRMVQVGSAAAPAMRLPAQAMRRGSLNVLGFAYYHAPIEDQAAAYAAVCGHALAGALTIRTSVMPLDGVAEAWRRQKAGRSERIVLVPTASDAPGRTAASRASRPGPADR